MSHYAFDVNLIEIINSATTDPLGSDTLIQLEKVCKEFLQFIIYKNKLKNRHTTETLRFILINYIKQVISVFIFYYLDIKYNQEKYASISINDTQSIIEFVYKTLYEIFTKELENGIKESEHTYSLQYNYKYFLRKNGLSKQEYPITAFKQCFRKHYKSYRFVNGYGKVKSAKLCFQHGLFELESMKFNNILNEQPIDECSICWEECSYDMSTITPCYHVFHKKCLSNWAISCVFNDMQYNCPMCKQAL